jgi:hypothetical protein
MMSWVRQIRWSLGLLALLVLVGCSTIPRFSDSRVTESTVKLDNLYVYSFLDVKDQDYGTEFLKLARAGLDTALSGANVRHVQAWSRDPELAGAALVTTRRYIPFKGNQQSTYVPVNEVVAANRPQERQFGAQYRLLIFPSQTDFMGMGYQFRIQWELVDLRTERSAWTATSFLETFAVASNENTQARANGFVSGLIDEWRRLRIL